jgi:hypothetical protein
MSLAAVHAGKSARQTNAARERRIVNYFAPASCAYFHDACASGMRRAADS